MRHLRIGIILGLFVMVGCDTSQDAPPDPQSGLGEIATEVEEQELLGRHLLKPLGQAGEIVDPEGNVQFEIKVNSIEMVDECPARSRDLAPQEGRFLVAQIEAHMALGFTGEHGEEDYFLPLLPEVFLILDESGAAIEGANSAAAWDCFADSELLPSFIQADEVQQGKVVLEVSEAPGYLAYSPHGTPGWAWAITADS